jgi:hypothetical protein
MIKYIVIINGGSGRPVFMVDDNDNAELFNSYQIAYGAAENHPMASARGYEIIEWNYFEGD